MTVRVLIADDHAVLRAGLRMLIATQTDLDVVGDVGDFSRIPDAVLEFKPDLLLMDMTMPGGDGIKWIAQLSKDSPQMKILVLTMHDDLALCKSALAAGALGFIVKSTTDWELIDAIRTVSQGRIYAHLQLDPQLNSDPLMLLPENLEETPLGLLSTREREVFDLAAIGNTNQAIADKMFLSVKTVESYRARLMTKLGVKNRDELTQLALRLGLLNSG